jgi:hypothetical protein
VFTEPELDELCDGFGVLIDAPETPWVYALGRPAEAGTNRIDKDKICNIEDAGRIVLQPERRDVGRVYLVVEDNLLWADCPHMDPQRGGTGPAIENKKDRAIGLVHIGAFVGKGKNACGRLARHIPEKRLPGDGLIRDGLSVHIERMPGHFPVWSFWAALA